jgi:hypothetical protein
MERCRLNVQTQFCKPCGLGQNAVKPCCHWATLKDELKLTHRGAFGTGNLA